MSDDDDKYHRRLYDGRGVYLVGPYWANNEGTGKIYTKATGSKEVFTAYYEGDNAVKDFRIRNSEGKTVGFTTNDNLRDAGPPPP